MDPRVIRLRKLNSETSPLLKLPAELRNAIYALVLTDQPEVKIKLKKVHLMTRLLRACHQIRQEAIPIFYGSNNFVVTHDTEAGEEIFRFLRHKQMFIRQPFTAVTLRQYTPSAVIELYRRLEEHYRDGSLVRGMVRTALENIAREMKVSDEGGLDSLLQRTQSNAANSLRAVATMLVGAGVEKDKVEYQGMIRTYEDDTAFGFYRRQEMEWVTFLGEIFMHDVRVARHQYKEPIAFFA